MGNAFKTYWQQGTYHDYLLYKYYPELISKITFENIYKKFNILDAELFNYLPRFMKQMITIPEKNSFFLI